MRRGYFFKLYHRADGKAKETMGVPVAVLVVLGRFPVIPGHSRSFSDWFQLIPIDSGKSFLFVPHSSFLPKRPKS